MPKFMPKEGNWLVEVTKRDENGQPIYKTDGSYEKEKIPMADTIYDVLERNALEALDAVPLESIFARRSARFMEAYMMGLNGRQAAWAARKYKGHRILPDSILDELEAAQSLNNASIVGTCTSLDLSNLEVGWRYTSSKVEVWEVEVEKGFEFDGFTLKYEWPVAGQSLRTVSQSIYSTPEKGKGRDATTFGNQHCPERRSINLSSRALPQSLEFLLRWIAWSIIKL
ncbi:hypothetical protein C8J56DRAFT_902042 [Mycena floridula]|nr:hypothetical protein C8J56DRAFT_902042 [Mycena floridula]